MPPWAITREKDDALRVTGELRAAGLEAVSSTVRKMPFDDLDLIRDTRELTLHPIVAYQASGEYALVRAAADKGLVDFERLMTELLVSMRRAGADLIISYDTRRRAGLETLAPR